LPGEDADAEVLEVRKKFWKGRAVLVRNSSALRRTGPHAEGCAGCDWSHYDLAAARGSKRALFLETMERIGGATGILFGDLPIEESALAYRLRNRFHVSGRGESARVGYFAPGTHDVAPAENCEALSGPMAALLTKLGAAIVQSGATVLEVATVESLDARQRLARATLPVGADRRDANALLDALFDLFDGVAIADTEGDVLARGGERRLWIPVGGREHPVTAATFFQSNRHLLESLHAGVAREAASAAPGRALDLFGGVGFFASALLDSGHAVVTVEANHAAVEQAAAAKKRWKAAGWEVRHGDALAFLDRTRDRFDVIVADPPRAGLGASLARALSRRAGRTLVYVSCEPATLARDLSIFLAEGLHIRSARLYDLYPLTHRVEAIVALSPSKEA
jgi:tRNA/tmRNA/rRNA uracil-C5-methylase (TrmA/RlmC/RlmD family)